MSYTYKGFWDPGASYTEDDLVQYYSSSGYDQSPVLYKCIKAPASSYRRRTGFTYPVDSVVFTSSDSSWLWTAKVETGHAPNSIGSTLLWERSDTNYHCPLKYFRLPRISDEGGLVPTYEKYITSNSDWVVIASSGSEEWVVGEHLSRSEAQTLMLQRNDRAVNLNGRDLMSVAENSDGWTKSEYYHENFDTSQPSFWKGPNGSVLESNPVFWVKVESSDPDYSSIVNSEWSSPNDYDVSAQEYSSSGLTTIVQGKYGSTDSSLEVGFNDVQGETDSDAYYISSVQNYKGNFEKNTEYLQFDVVRNPYSHLFCYARTDISQPDQFDSGDAIALANVIIKSPIENVENSRHVGTIELGGGSVSVNGSASSDFTELKIGNVLDFSGSSLVYVQNRQRFIVIGRSSSILYLGIYGALDPVEFGVGQLMRPEAYDNSGSPSPVSFDVIRQSIEISIDSADHELWSSDQFFFDPDYGSTVSFNSRNKIFDFGDGYQSVSPMGINSLRMEMNLKFSNRSSREANCIVHFLENNLGQHETDKQTHELRYDQGISGFRMDGDSLYYPYRNNENLIRRFYCFDYKHEIENEDVNTVDVNIINTTASTLNVATQMFVTKAEAWSAEDEYFQHSVVLCPENLKYYYSWTDSVNRSFKPCVSQSGVATSVNKHLWTREFYWKPSIPLSVDHKPSIKEYSSASSSYSQYFPEHKQNINNLEFNLKFENRNNEEAYSILHFLESHLGYLSFLFTPPAPYNRKRRFYCESWDHTYVFRNNHTISANFKQFPLGQNTPLDDDEIDNILPAEKDSSGVLSMDLDVDFDINKPVGSASLHLKKVISIKNIGGKEVIIFPSSVSLTNSALFSKSNIGVYSETTPVSGMTNIPDGSYSLTCSSSGDGSVVYSDGSNYYLHDSTGRVFLDGDYLGIDQHFTNIISQNLTIPAGEERFVEVYFTAAASATQRSVLSLEYSSGATQELTYKENGQEYLEGNLIQEGGVVYRVASDFTSSTFANDSSNYIEHKTLISSSIDAYVNKSKNDLRKSSLYVNLNFPASVDSHSYYFDNHGFSDTVDFYKDLNGENFYKNAALNASHDGCRLALVSSEEDLLAISKLPSISGGFYLTRVYWDGGKYVDYDTLGDEVLNDSGALVNAEKIIEDIIPEPETASSGLVWDSDTDKNIPGILMLQVPDGYFAGLNDSSSFVLKVAPFSSLSDSPVEGYIVQKVVEEKSSSINLAQRISSSGEVGAMSLEDFEEVNIFLSGNVNSPNPHQPALKLGGPWNDEVKINLYLGNASWIHQTNGETKTLADKIRGGESLPSASDYRLIVSSCSINGRGGSGGEGMVSEGEIYEAGKPTTSNENYIPAGKGENGGGAIFIDGLEGDSAVQLRLYFLEGSSVRGGGGGGAGGLFVGDGKRIKTHSLVNFGGGGGGGAPFGISGSPSGKPGTVSGGGLGGLAINNDHNFKTHLGGGTKGGGYGEAGTNLEVNLEVLAEGGLPGYAIKVEDSFLDITYNTYSASTHTSAPLTLSGDTIDQPFFSGKIVDV
tara:strand:- start:3349 stop:7935 length:4587 start_codon:yes stop_codon:yes gene_type:complete